MSDLEKLRKKHFAVHDGFVFFSNDANDDARAIQCIQHLGANEAQFLVNHEPLRKYLENTEEQRRFAQELTNLWSARLLEEFPEIPTRVRAIREEGSWVVSVTNL